MSRLALALAVVMLACCTPTDEQEVVHPTPLPFLPAVPIDPSAKDPMEVIEAQTPKGVEVTAHRYMVANKDLWLVAMDELDRDFHPWAVGWVVRIVQPQEEGRVVKAERRIYVPWRKDGHQPTWVMLPQLRSLVEKATSN